MSITQSIDSLLQSMTTPYSVRSAIGYGDDGNPNISGAEYIGANFNDPIWKESNQMGKDQFLHLLVVQMKYQDPLSPMENTEFVSQLAQFRALETSENTEKAIRDLDGVFRENLSAQVFAASSISNSSAMTLIGKEVRMRQVTVSYDGKADAQIPINVHLGNSNSVTVRITDSEGKVIKRIEATDKDAENSTTVYWDGTDDQGKAVGIGNYLVSVEGQETDASRYAFVQAVVEGVRFTESGVLVKIGGREISIGEVLDVSMGEGAHVAQSGALSLLGKLVHARHSELTYRAGADEEHAITIKAAPNQQVTVEIKETAGNRTIATLRGTADASGNLKLFWDGTMSSGEKAPQGQYGINVVGSDKNPGLYAYTEGIVDGLTSLTGDYKLKINGVEVSLSDIMDISTPKVNAAA